jgi:hypothetical protein
MKYIADRRGRTRKLNAKAPRCLGTQGYETGGFGTSNAITSRGSQQVPGARNAQRLVSERGSQGCRSLNMRPTGTASSSWQPWFSSLFSVGYVRTSGPVQCGRLIALVVTKSEVAPVGAPRRRSPNEDQTRQGRRRCHDRRDPDRRIRFALDGWAGGARIHISASGSGRPGGSRSSSGCAEEAVPEPFGGGTEHSAIRLHSDDSQNSEHNPLELPHTGAPEP